MATTTTEDPTLDADVPDGLDGNERAKRYIARVNAQAKAEREAREKIEAEAKATADRLAALEKQMSDAEAKKLAENNQFKELAEKYAIEKNDLAKALEETKAENAKRLERERVEREQAAVRLAVEKAAVKAGIIDEDLIDIFDLSSIETKDGKPVKDSVAAFIDAKRTEKPKLFAPVDDEQTTTTQQPRNDRGQFDRPTEQRGKPGVIDWNALTPEQFAEKERELRARRYQ